MRPRLLHPIRERAHERPARRGHGTRGQSSVPETRLGAAPSAPEAIVANPACDPEVERVRKAGGPLDEATYSCACGFLFSAAVSTTVVCPHCGGGQAW